MILNDLINHTSEWLKGTGPHSDIVISSRIRFARNLEKIPFPHWTNKKQSAEVLEKVEAAAPGLETLRAASVFHLADLDNVDKQFLIERHLMSYEHAQKNNSKAVSRAPKRACAWPSSASAAGGESTATRAVACPCGSGNSFSTAAVMTPSVPSAPMNRCLRS